MPNFYEYFIYPLLIALIIAAVRYFLVKNKEYNTIADKFRSSFSSTLHSLKYEDAGIETTCDILKRDVEGQKKAKADFEQHLTEKEREKLENYWRIWLRPDQFRAKTSNEIGNAQKLGIKYVGFFQEIAKRKKNNILILIIGLALIAIVVLGGYLDKDGWFFLGKPKNSTISEILKPQEEKLLSIVYKYQKDLGLNKLIIQRTDGTLYFDEEEKRGKYEINIIGEVFDITSGFKIHASEFENLILDIPREYLQQIPETRYDDPYVLKITEKGIEYIKKQ